MIRKEPDWAANRLQAGEKAIERLAALEASYDREAENCRLLQDRFQRLVEGNLKLKEEIAELKQRNDNLLKEYAINRDGWTQRITELETQHEKDKCCGNCQHSENGGLGFVCIPQGFITVNPSEKCDKWEERK